MTPLESEHEQMALDWVRRTNDPDFTDWEAHMRWLEADPRNAQAFDKVSLDIDRATRGLAPAQPRSSAAPVANDNDPTVRRGRWQVISVAAGLVAASCAAFLLWPQHFRGADMQTISTLPGAPRQIMLVDGTRVDLNGDTSLRIGRDRRAVLLRGEAFLNVAHHPDTPFELQVGSRVIQDVGTAFDVSFTPRSTRVSVAEGMVAIDPQTENIRLAAGQEARLSPGGDILRKTVTQDHAIGGWRKGRLVYQEASWSEVVTDLSRSLGVPVAEAPNMTSQRFTGVIVIDPNQALTMRRLASVAGVVAVPDGQGWRIVPH